MKKLLAGVFFFAFSLWLCAEAIQFRIQPYRNLHCYVADKKLPHRVLSHDNSLGLIRIDLPSKLDSIRLSVDGFRDIVLQLATIPTSPIVLDKKDSAYRFMGTIDVGRQPKSVTFINATTVAVPLLEGKGIDIINILSGEKKHITPPEKYARRQGFVESLVLKEQKELWVSQMTSAAIHIFSLEDFRYKRSIQSSGKWGKVMAFNPIHNCVYFTNWISKDVSIIDPTNYREIKRIKLGAVPRGMVCTKDGAFLYLAEFEIKGKAHGQIVKIDTKTLKAVARFGKKGAKRHIVMSRNEKRLYVSDMAHATIEIFATTDNSLIKRIAVGAKPNTIVLSPDEKLLYVSCRGSNNPTKGYLHKGLEMGKIYVIDTETLRIKEWWEGANQPTGLDISPDGKTLVFSDFLDHRLRIYTKY